MKQDNYDFMGRRVSKKFQRFTDDPEKLWLTPGGEITAWASNWEQRFVYETGGWNLLESVVCLSTYRWFRAFGRLPFPASAAR